MPVDRRLRAVRAAVDEAPDDQLDRACLALRLAEDAAEGWRDLPDPPQDAGDPDEARDRLSSA